MKSRYLIALGLFLSLFGRELAAVELKYRFRPGSVYEYEHSVRRSSRMAAYKTNTTQPPVTDTQKFTLRAIDFQNGSHIIDVVSSAGTYRRYIRENGSLAGAPGEAGQTVPFLITFPATDWKISERHQVQQNLISGDSTLPATWNMLLKSVDTEKQLAEILFTITVKLPEDRIRRKEYTLKGRAMFDYGQGILQQAEWASSYRFVFSNREMAVARDLWLFEHQETGTLKLVSSKE